MKYVAIIGGGVAGLLALKHTLKYPQLRPILYETTQRIGGVWVYDGKDTINEGDDFRNSPVSVYENLVANQSKQVMEFPDFKHVDENLPSYLTHESVLNYLKEYCTHFRLEEWIKFGHKVLHVTPVPKNGDVASDDVCWQLDVLDVSENKSFAETFDAVIICNGHYTKPNIPVIPGLQYFTGKAIHSRSYRRPSDFVGENVLVVGAGASGVDIALDVATTAKDVYLSNRGPPLKSKLPPNIHEVPEVLHLNEDGMNVTFVDGLQYKISSLILATGYHYDFPFLDKKCGITIEGDCVTPLFKHIFNIKHHSMLFIGLPRQIPVFKMLYLQAVFGAKTVSGEVALPSKESMLLDQKLDYQTRLDLGWPLHKAHVMAESVDVLPYLDYLAKAAGVDEMPGNVKRLYLSVVQRRWKHLTKYKDENYILGKTGEYIIEGNE